MNKYYIKQKLFSWKDKFSIKNGEGEDVFFVEGEWISIAKRLHMYDAGGHEVFLIEQKLITFLPEYEILAGGRVIARVTKKISFFTPEYYVEGPGWKVEGALGAHNYKITGSKGTVAVISKAWLSWGDFYEISVEKEINERLALAVVMVIDAVMASDNNNAAAMGMGF